MEQIYSVQIEGGEEVQVRLELEGTTIKNHTWIVIGSLKLIAAAKTLKKSFPKNLNGLCVPMGADASTLLLKELVAKIKGEWVDDDNEICHCRKINQRAIERAIILGAHTLEKVRKRTSANTGCGACLPDVQELITKRVS